MGAFLLCALLGYIFGTLNPAALIASIKKIDLRQHGTQNLGATNVALSIGKKYGFLVMIFDMGKAYASVMLAQLLFPTLTVAGLVAGSCSVVGHIFPFHLKFKGGKGSAPFGGMILAINPILFLLLLLFGILVMLITGYTFVIPISAAAISPIVVGFYMKSFPAAFILLIIAALMLFKHRENFKRIRTGTEATLRSLINKRKH